jgi:hypothetical protein
MRRLHRAYHPKSTNAARMQLPIRLGQVRHWLALEAESPEKSPGGLDARQPDGLTHSVMRPSSPTKPDVLRVKIKCFCSP